MSEHEITRVEPSSVTKLGAVFGALTGALLFFSYLAGSSPVSNVGAAVASFGLFTLGGVIVGAIALLISAAVYDTLAGVVGGVRVGIEER